jgi:hypothetical protein
MFEYVPKFKYFGKTETIKIAFINKFKKKINFGEWGADEDL